MFLSMGVKNMTKKDCRHRQILKLPIYGSLCASTDESLWLREMPGWEFICVCVRVHAILKTEST
jgi:hypothetical protein